MTQYNKLLILSTQRSGSSLFCDYLIQTGQLGYPTERLNKAVDMQVAGVSIDLLNEEFCRSVQLASTPNGILSFKVMANHIESIGLLLRNLGIVSGDSLTECFYEYFKESYVVRIRRKSRIRQAISRYVASITSRYHDFDISDDLIRVLEIDERPLDIKSVAVDYCFEKIFYHYRSISFEEMFLDEYINYYGLTVVNYEYESFVHDFSYVNSILKAFSLSPTNIDITMRRFKKLASIDSDVIYNNFVRDLTSGIHNGCLV